jgi:hypothetical protein
MNLTNCNAQKLNEKSFDFWVGNWNLTWQDKQGKQFKGINIITKILDNKVIQENFEDPITGFKGRSLSVFDSRTKTWHQAWVDNQGGYYDFIGDLVDGNLCFITKMQEIDAKKAQRRMVFKDIKKDAFVWVWEGTQDGGKTWQLLWKIDYSRI